MTIVFVSNYFNHHQKPLSDELYKLSSGKYFFIETQKVEEERINMGWGYIEVPSYVKKSYTSCDDLCLCQKLIDEADVVIFGSAPNEMLKNRIKNLRVIFRYSERPLKKGLEIHKYIFRFIKWHKQNPKKANIYMLCASAYTSCDYRKFRLFLNKTYKWGYFTEVVRYNDLIELINRKKKNSILWVSRFIDLKHPEVVIELAKMLKNEKYQFEICLIGTGPLEDMVKKEIVLNNLENHITLLGTMSPENVRKYMELSQIFIFTSDYNEGWGAVLNEAMNSCCACVASDAIGSVPFLIKNYENGIIYTNGNTFDLFSKVKYLMDNQQKIAEIGKSAYDTISQTWSPEIAAKRFMTLATEIIEKRPLSNFVEGPCSKD